MDLCSPDVIVISSEDVDCIFRVEINDSCNPTEIAVRTLFGVNDGKSICNAIQGTIPNGSGCLRTVEPDLAADVIIFAQSGKGATQLQLITACLVIFRNQIIGFHDFNHLGHLRAILCNKTVKHRPCRQDIDCLCSP